MRKCGRAASRVAWREWLVRQKDVDTVGVLCAAERGLKALWGRVSGVSAGLRFEELEQASRTATGFSKFRSHHVAGISE